MNQAEACVLPVIARPMLFSNDIAEDVREIAMR